MIEDDIRAAAGVCVGDVENRDKLGSRRKVVDSKQLGGRRRKEKKN